MSKVAKAAVSLMVVGILSKVLGFIRELVLASAYGASSYSDAYLIALNIPLVVFASIATSLATTFIPLYCNIRQKGDEKEALKFTSNLINIVGLLCVVFAIMGFVFAKPIVKIFAVGFEGETLRLATNFTKVSMLGIVFIGLNYVITSYLQVKENFVIPGLIGIPYNIIIIVSIILSVKFNINILIYGTLLAMVSQLLFQLPFAYKKGFRCSPHINMRDENIRKMMTLVGPVFIGVAVNQINTLVDRTLASTLVEGSISALNYANRLNQFVMALFIASISTVVYPMLSDLASKDDKKGFTNAISKAINTVIILVVPISVGAIVLANPIVEVLFQRGAFDEKATQMTAIALVFYSLGMIGFGLREILSRVFYSLQDTKTPMINGAIAMVLNIILNLILVRYLAHAGLALATSISALVTIVLLFNSLRKKVGDFDINNIVLVLGKVTLSSIIMGIVTKISYNYINNLLGSSSISQVTTLGISIILGIITYGTIIAILKLDEIKFIITAITKKLKRK